MIAGNHDSARRLQYLSGLVTRVGLHVVGEVGAAPAGVRVAGADGVEVVFWPLAYTDPETARGALGRADIHTHEAVLRGAAGPRARADGRRRPPRGRRPRLRHRRAAVGVRAAALGRRLRRGLARPSSTASTTSRSATCTARSASASACATPARCSSTRSTRPTTASRSRVVDVDAAGARHRRGGRAARAARPGPAHAAAFDELLTAPDAGRVRRTPTSRSLLTDTDPVLDPMQKLRAVYPNILSLRREAWLGRRGHRAGARRAAGCPRASSSASSSRRSPASRSREAQQREVDAALTASGREEREAAS